MIFYNKCLRSTNIVLRIVCKLYLYEVQRLFSVYHVFPGHIGNVDIKRHVWARFASVFWFWFYCFSFNCSSVVVYIFILLLCFCAAIWRNKEWLQLVISIRAELIQWGFPCDVITGTPEVTVTAPHDGNAGQSFSPILSTFSSGPAGHLFGYNTSTCGLYQ